MTLQLDIGVPVTAPLSQQVDYIRRAEELGFAGVGIGDTLATARDIFVTMAMAAQQTERIELYPAVANPVTRHPTVLANALATLTELAPGRVKLGLGRGGRDLLTRGMERASLLQLREAMTGIRAHLREWHLDPTPPLLLGASGPQTLELSGELGDEILLQIGPDAEARRQALLHVRDGADKAGRHEADIPVTDYLIVSIADDRDEALRQAMPWVQYMVGVGTFQLALGAHEVSAEDLHSLGRLTGGWRGHLADLLLVAGTADEVAKRFAVLEADGMRRVCCMVPGGPRMHRSTLEALGAHVVPAFA